MINDTNNQVKKMVDKQLHENFVVEAHKIMNSNALLYLHNMSQ